MYTVSPILSFTHAFTDRFGGVSEGIFASLNLGENLGDEEKSVRENYRRLFDALGIEKFVSANQVHSNTVLTVTEKDARELFSPGQCAGDALVTDRKGLALMVKTADCVPILMEDAENGVIAAVHAGWRGTAAKIAANAVEAMTSLGARAENIRAAIGPAIEQECFQVGPEVAEALSDAGCASRCRPDAAEGRFLADLKGANRDILLMSGVKSENIWLSPACTRCQHEKYWSHRYTNGKRGVQVSIIVM